MTMVMPPATRLPTNGHPRRAPKLAVRNRSLDHVADNDLSHSDEISSEDQFPSSSLNTESPTDPDSECREPPPPRESHKTARNRDTPLLKFSKKKSSGVLGFLALKEPSTSAFEDFAQQERRRAAQRGGRATAVMMPGVSSQRLPEHVPKVNSKWDGLPPSTKKKDEDRLKRTRNSTISISTYGSSSRTRASSGEKSRPAVKATFLDPPSPVLASSNETFLSLPSPPILSLTSATSKPACHDSLAGSPTSSRQPSTSELATTSWLSDADEDGDASRPYASTFLDNATTHCSSQRHVTYANQSRQHRPEIHGQPRTGSSSTSSSGLSRSYAERDRLRQATKNADVLPWEMFEPPSIEGKRPDLARSSTNRMGSIIVCGAGGGLADESGRGNGSDAGGRLKRFGRSLRSK